MCLPSDHKGRRGLWFRQDCGFSVNGIEWDEACPQKMGVEMQLSITFAMAKKAVSPLKARNPQDFSSHLIMGKAAIVLGYDSSCNSYCSPTASTRVSASGSLQPGQGFQKLFSGFFQIQQTFFWFFLNSTGILLLLESPSAQSDALNLRYQIHQNGDCNQ